MVYNFFSFFGSELKSVTQSAAVLALAVVFANILSLFRDRLLAAEFGASRSLDIYYASFRIPDFFYTFSLFFAASTALIPIILEKFSEDKKGAEEFFGNIFALFFIVTVVLIFFGYIFMPVLVPYFAPGFSLEEQAQVTQISRILLLSPLFLGLSNLISSVIQSFKRFYVYAASPLFYNLGIIIGILFFMPRWGLEGIVWGVALGAFMHLVIQLPTVFSLGFSLRPRLPKFTPDVARSLKMSLPRTLGLSLNQLVLSIITAMASTLGAGAVSVFNFASNLQQVPLSVIALSYSVSAFPTLAASYAKKGTKDFMEHFALALRHIFFWSLPATVLFIVLRAQIVRVILGAGAFSWVDTRLTAAALLLFSLSILSQGLIMLYIRAFYATGHTFLPVGINVVSSAAVIISSYSLLNLFQNSSGFREWFLGFLRVGDITMSAVLVLPLAISLGSLLNLLLLAIYFARNFKSQELAPEIKKSLKDSVSASFGLGFAAYASLNFFADFFNLNTFVGIFLQGLLSGLIGILAGTTILFYYKNKEFGELYALVRERVWRKSKTVVVTSEPEKLP
jgi:putative peptidoglycan lipid II flippase